MHAYTHVHAYTHALKAEQEKDAAEKEKEDLQRELCGKRLRPEASTIEANADMPADIGDLDLADWRRHATKWLNRSQVQFGSREDALAPRTVSGFMVRSMYTHICKHSLTHLYTRFD